MSPDTDGTVAAFCRRFPNSVARDPRLSDAALVLLAYRSTFTGKYALNPKTARDIVRGKGLGRNAFERGTGEVKAAGYLERWQGQRKSEGTFGFALEKLTLPDDGLDGRVVWRSWFDGSFSVKELAAFLFLRAGVGRASGGHAKVYARELAQRFGWSRPTTAKVIRDLVGRGVLVPSTIRKFDGTFAATTYKVPNLSKDQSTVKKRGHGLRGHRNAGHTQSERALHEAEYPSQSEDVEVTARVEVEASADTTSAECGSPDALQRLIKADHARTLSRYLRKD